MVEWDPFEEIKKAQREVNKQFNRLFSKDIFNIGFKQPRTDILQNSVEIRINVILPGINKKDIIVEMNEDYLDIKAHVKGRKIVSKKGYYKEESSFKGYRRMIPLPPDLNLDKAKVKFTGEILKIRIPKKKAKKIVVK